MFRIIFLIVLLLHGMIHSLGFLKAFNIGEINQLSGHISKPAGLLWILTLLIFLAVSIQYIIKNELWWLTAFLGVLISQLLILIYWHDAKFGTIPNLVIIVTAVLAFAGWNFTRTVDREIRQLFSQQLKTGRSIVTADMLTHLPYPVKNWLMNSGAVGKEKIYTVRLKQKGLMKMKPEQEDWYKARAEQYFTTEKPGFIWKVDMSMMSLINVTGRDLFFDGKGRMMIKVLSLINVVNASGKKIDQGTLQRYLGEIVWFPTAALNPYIVWEGIDSVSAKATMTYGGTTGSAVFHFNNRGEFVKYCAKRFKGNGDNAQLEDWIITVDESKEMNGIIIPTKLSASWKLKAGEFTWYKIEISEIEYNKYTAY